MSEDNASKAIRVEIGNKIKELRKGCGMTQQDLAAAIGVGRSHISRIENGDYNIGIELLSRLTTALGCKIELTKR